METRKATQISPAIDYIEANFHKKIVLADIARATHLSESRLGHIFKEEMGITVIDYLMKVRIENAKLLLAATNQSCIEICFQVGYDDPSYFTRTFKKFVGMTPRLFRAHSRQAAPAQKRQIS